MKKKINDRAKKKIQRSAIINLLGTTDLTWEAFIHFLVIILLLSWFADGIGFILENVLGKTYKTYFDFGKPIFSFALLILYFSHVKEDIKDLTYSPEIDVKSERPEACKCLIWFLSNHFKPNEKIQKLINNPELVTDKESEFNKYNWLMPYKAVELHNEALECIMVITSSGEKGSNKEFDQFEQFIENIPWKKKSVEIIDVNKNGIDFEDLNLIYKEIGICYQEAAKKGYQENDVIIDVTGGQKPPSIAGSLVTLYQDRKCQYVSTVDQTVKSYNIDCRE